jgi:hypothetical protein
MIPEKECVMRLSLMLSLLAATLATAQDVRINANSTTPSVLAVTNTATSDTIAPSKGKPAVYGVSQPAYNRGIGVEGIGAHAGVYALGGGPAFPTGSTNYNTRIGVEAYASGGFTNMAVYATVVNPGDYAGYFVGNLVYTGSFYQMSDSTLKTNIQPMAPALGKLMSIKPKNYEMDGSKTPHTLLAQGPQDGVLAQDVEKVYPELVSEVPIYNGDPSNPAAATKYKSVNYIGLVPILIKAVQEQQAEIDTLQQQIRVLKGQ